MPELTLTGAVDVVERQVRRVRRRKNLYELQRALYLTIAAGAGAATVLLPLALFASTRVFGLAVAAMLLAFVAIAMLLGGRIRRRWLNRSRAVAWIDAHGARDGRMRTLLELRSRATSAPGFFHALLASQVDEALPSWTPRRLMPHAVPRAAATVVIALGVLALVFRLAALGLPAPSGLADGGESAGTSADRSARLGGSPAERSVAAPGMPSEVQRQGRTAGTGAPDPAEDSSLTKLASALQENVRQQVWGKAWERIRDQLARSAGTDTVEGSDDGDARAREDGPGDDADGSELARTGGEGASRHRTPSHDHTARDETAPSARDGASEADASDDDAEKHADGGGSGAGTGTSPSDLFGGAPVATDGSAGSFELSLAARMKSDHAGRRGGGAAPEADPDARPALATDQRREAAAHRMAIPAAYEQVVREVFAHHEQP